MHINILQLISFSIVTFNLLLYVFLVFRYKIKRRVDSGNLTELPSVSVLIAVRNEEENVSKLINQLVRLDYPKQKLEILIGNDGSSDSTFQLLLDHNSSEIKVFDITSEVMGFRGKMNVLAQLIEKASGDYLLLTDADVAFDSQWLKGHIQSLNQDTALGGGFTGISKQSLFEGMQHTDMAHYQGILRVLIDLGRPVAAIGNNLIVKQSSLKHAGGYANIAPSVVEDMALFHVLKDSKAKIQLNYNPSTYIETKGAKSVRDLLEQRRRWYEATKWVPTWLKILIIIKLMFLPSILFLIQLSPLFISIFIAKLLVTYLFLNEVVKSIKQTISIKHTILYELYEPIIYFFTFIYSLLPIKVQWKGRKY